MTISSLGDLSVSYQMRRDTASLKAELQRATNEISSGYSADIADKLRGDFARLSAIEADLSRLDGYTTNIDEFGFLLETQQGVIGKLRDLASLSTTLLSIPVGVGGSALADFGAEGLSVFTASLSSLNVQAGGRAVFSGTASDQAAVADADTILLAIEAEIAIAGATTTSDVEAIVDTWFANGGGFDTVGYTGGDASVTSLRLSDSERIDPPITAEADGIRQTLASMAMAALAGRGLFAGDADERGDVLRRAGEKLLVANGGLIELQANIGRQEGALGRASAEVSSQRDGLQIAKAGLIEVDPYDAATRLQTAELRLQSLYTLTGRLSRLSLAEYLR